MAHGIVDLVIVVDDGSQDETVAVARTLDRVQVEVHPMNRGYGANQKTCYRHALAAGGDIIIMIHPDYQYTPQLIPSMVALVASELYPCVLASRILGGGALRGGMPWWKYISNRFLTFIEKFSLARSYRSTIPATVPFHARCWNDYRSRQIQMTLCSTTKFSRK